MLLIFVRFYVFLVFECRFFFVTLQSFYINMNIYKLTNISELAFDSVVTVGMFDGVHIGHQHILSMLTAEARRRRMVPVVVTFDRHPLQVLCPDRPFVRVSTNEERYRLIEACGVTDVVEIHFTEEVAQLSACEFFREILVGRLRARSLVLGFDNMFGSKQRNDFDRLPSLADEMGVNVLTDTAVKYHDVEVSSTQIRQTLLQGDVCLASQMLGYRYRLWGEVVKGRQVGRTLGFPTANVCLEDASKALPADGVYAVRVLLPDGSARMGMANFGGQPTFGLDKPVFEVNIFDFEGDLYGSVLDVEFVVRLRDVCKFDGVEALVAQLNKDRNDAREALSRQDLKGSILHLKALKQNID